MQQILCTVQRKYSALIDKSAYSTWYKGADKTLEAYNTVLGSITPESVLPINWMMVHLHSIFIMMVPDTDWGDLLLKNSTSQNYEVNVAGGSEKTNFNISLGANVRPWFDEELIR